MSKGKATTRVRTKPQTIGLTVEEALRVLRWDDPGEPWLDEDEDLLARLNSFVKGRDGA